MRHLLCACALLTCLAGNADAGAPADPKTDSGMDKKPAPKQDKKSGKGDKKGHPPGEGQPVA